MPHNDLTVLYEDRSLVLCVKPVGVLSEDSDSAASMPALLRAHYRSLHQPDYIATVHRLDKITGGLMLFSRSKAATGKLIPFSYRKKADASAPALGNCYLRLPR